MKECSQVQAFFRFFISFFRLPTFILYHKTMLFFLVIIAIFAVSKPLFMLHAGAVGMGVQLLDYMQVIWHGLQHDVIVAAYLTMPVYFALLAGSIKPRRYEGLLRATYYIYIGIVSVFLALTIIADACLYPFWDIKLDTTVIGYLGTLKGITSSVSPLYILTLILLFFGASILIYWLLYLVRPDFSFNKDRLYAPQSGGIKLFSFRFFSFNAPPFRGIFGSYNNNAKRFKLHPYLGFLIILLVLSQGYQYKREPDVGMVYYSPRQILNHGAVNPVFSFFHSLTHRGNNSPTAHFYDKDRCSAIFDSLQYNTESLILAQDSLLRTTRPNVLVIVMEGCGAQFVEALGGAKDITPNLNRICRHEGLPSVVFTRCYANSFRTDRGLVSALSGFAAYPDLSVMRLPALRDSLPGIAKALSVQGYSTQVLYGGDISFTDMDKYFASTGYEHLISDKDFPDAQKNTHAWGVTDSLTFERLSSLTASHPTDRPWHTMFLTLASHEPWIVPYKALRRKGKIANSMAYLDHCLGKFLDSFSQTPQWDNTLVILIADHGVTWPSGMSEANTKKYHIPMIWTGGAIRRSRDVTTICNQSDLPATLLGQMGIDHNTFFCSRDVLSQTYTYPCAQHAWAEGFGIIDDSGATIIDLHTQRPITDKPVASARRARYARAFMQQAYGWLNK